MATALTGQSGRKIPAHVPTELVRDFDYHSDPSFLAGPFEAFDEVRDLRAFWSTSHGGFWVLTRAEDIEEAWKHPELFSSESRANYEDLSPTRRVGGDHRLIPSGVDPPEHGQYRRLLAPRFSPGSAQEMTGRATDVCRDLIETFVGNGQCDFLEEFARPYPTILFTEMLGIPTEQSDEFLEWEYDMIRGDVDVMASGREKVTRYLIELIEERSARPTDDLISYIASGTVGGSPTTSEEVLDTCLLLFLAGLDTITAGLSWIFEYLSEHPEDRRRLVEEPDLLAGAIEELLRVQAFVNTSRVVAQDVEFAGVTMRSGEQVLLSTALASRDPIKFDDAERTVLDRQRNFHTAFGAGPHRCLGTHLARLELNVALAEWLKRIPDFWIANKAEINYHGGGVMGFDKLKLAWR